jgi:Small-conductance mechanosensitive channel
MMEEMTRILGTAKATDFTSELVEKIIAKGLDIGLGLIGVVLIYFIGSRLIKSIRKMLKKALIKSNMDASILYFMDSVANALLYLLLVAIMLSVFGVTTTSIAALIGAGGVTLGLALQGSLSNFAGGVLLLLLHPFRVGDYIVEDSGKNEGRVTKIELFYTTLVTGDNRAITIPNGILTNNSLTNVTAMKKRRLDGSVSISYYADLKLAKQLIESILAKNENILKDEEVAVYVERLEETAVVIGFRGWFLKEHYMAAKWSILEQIKYGFDEQQIWPPEQQLAVKIREK